MGSSTKADLEARMKRIKPETKTGSAGFTIIEALIVLASAGLILMMVFLALPALQRNARNSQRRQDASKILGLVSHFELTNSGVFPADNTYLSSATLNYYSLSNVSTTPMTPGGASVTGTGIDSISIYNYHRCNEATPGQATSVGAGYRDIVAVFRIETGSGAAGQCVQL